MQTESSRPQTAPSAREQEAILAEMAELVELQAGKLSELRAEIQALRRERDDVELELVMAQGWVRELAGRVEEAEARLDEREAWTLSSRIASSPADG
jgi:hypothetical protein